jgi:predicted regulator of Ras-like GTPase activity (Roadblock/LC7/MglB family)
MFNKGTANLVITEEGIRAINTTLGNLVMDSGAKAALLLEKSGQLIAAQGETNAFDTMSLSALITGSFNSNKAIAGLVGETEFRKMFQQGKQSSIFMALLNTGDLISVIFSNQITIGKIKFKVDQILETLNEQMQAMYNSTPETPFKPASPSAAPKLNDLF